MNKIILDAGHGGFDFGASNKERKEKDDNLKIATDLANKLRSMGYEVILTRSNDEFIPLIERSNISNKINPDLFLSIHRNANDNLNANGLEVYVFKQPTEFEKTFANNVLKNTVQVSSNNASAMKNNGLHEANFSVLRNTTAPSMLLELGYISNNEDNAKFDANYPLYIDAIAAGIAETFDILNSENQSKNTNDQQNMTSKEMQINQIRRMLNTYYSQNLPLNGEIDQNLKLAIVRGIQTELTNRGANLVVNGIFDLGTKNAFPILHMGDRNNLVFLLQSLLLLNDIPMVLDGVYGNDTANTVRDVQNKAGLVVDGLAGPNTIQALLNKNFN